MVKVSDLKDASTIAEEDARTNPEVKRELERTELANDVAIRVIRYRAESALSQTQLAKKLGMHQSAIARLEAGDHEPSLAMLGRLAGGLGLEFRIDISSDGRIQLCPERSGPLLLAEGVTEVGVMEANFRSYLAAVQENVRRQQQYREAFELLLANWRAHQSELQGRPLLSRWALHLNTRLAARRLQERAEQESLQEDQAFLEELERLLQAGGTGDTPEKKTHPVQSCGK